MSMDFLTLHHVYSNFQKGDEVRPSDPIYLDANCHIDFPVRFLSSNEAPTNHDLDL